MIRLDLGGGECPRPGHVNVDILPDSDVVLDLDGVGTGNSKFPWATGSVDSIYSSHCFEHLKGLHGVWMELARVLKIGGSCEVRVPHWAQSQAHILGHTHALSEQSIFHLYEFPETWWPSSEKWLVVKKIEYVRSRHFPEASKIFPTLTPLQIVQFIQDTCHECRYHFVCEIADFSKGQLIVNSVEKVVT